MSWIAKTTTYTAADWEWILADTSWWAWTLTLPATPSVWDSVWVNDSTSSFATNNLTIARNWSKIHWETEDLVVNIKDASFLLIYTWTVTWWKLDTYLETGTDIDVWWDVVLLADVTLWSAATSLSSWTITAKRKLTIDIIIPSTDATSWATAALRFNSDSWNNYAYNYSKNWGAASGSAASSFALLQYARNRSSANYDNTTISASISNLSDSPKMWVCSSSSWAPNTVDVHFWWFRRNNTSESITEILLRTEWWTANLAAWTRMIIYGSKD